MDKKIYLEILKKHLTEDEIRHLSELSLEKFVFIYENQKQVLDILIKTGLLHWYIKLTGRYYYEMMKLLGDKLIKDDSDNNAVVEAMHNSYVDAFMLEQLCVKMKEMRA